MMENSAIIVTGAASGIGRAMVDLLREQGKRVVAIDVAPGTLADRDDADLRVHQADVRDKAALSAIIAGTEAEWRIGGLVCCAGIFRSRPFLELDDAFWDEIFGINVKGSLFACQAVLPALRRGGGGSIVLFSSSLARNAAPGLATYVAGKEAVLGLMRSLALEVAAEGIRVNAISPGLTNTGMPRGVFSDAQLVDRAAAHPLGRLGEAADMAQTAAFLLSEDASYITGQDIRVDGGSMLF
jgi:NAD(P)-dependent dehydrogenase (short-subunit alcohol dehydrogenase family)